jgi:competence protein ComEC
MRSFVIGFVVGVVCLQMQSALPSQWIAGTLIAASVAALMLSRATHQTRYKVPLWMVCGIAGGFIWAAWLAHCHLAQELPKEWEGHDLTLIGTVDSLPSHFPEGIRFNFTVEQAMSDSGAKVIIPTRVTLGWYANPHQGNPSEVGDIRPGERWRLHVRLQRPHGNANPYGFDYEVWLLEQNLRATGYVRPDTQDTLKNERLSSFVPRFGNVVERVRGVLRENILTALAGRKYASVIVALVIGDQSAISQADWKIFNRTGIGHLISISGLHITMIAGIMSGLFFWLWRRSFFTSAQLPLILPAQKAAALVGVTVAWLYVLLSGFGVPAQRTLYMVTVVAIALWSGRIASVSYVLSAALGVVVLLDPWAVLWPGFWLSFGAVAVILFASVGRTKLRLDKTSTRKARFWHVFNEAARTQYAVTIGLVPLTMLLFGQISIISPIANAIAIPLVSFVVTPFALIGSVLPQPMSAWVLIPVHEVVVILAAWLSWLSHFSIAVWSAPIPSIGIFMCAIVGTLWMMAPRGWPVRWLGMVGFLPMMLNMPAHPKQGEMWVTAFDVGQGMALLIETEKHRLLYDTGPAYSLESDGGNRVILPYLKARGIGKLDGMIVSHNDSDHSGGALSILGETDVQWVTSSLAMDSPIVAAAKNHRRCAAGQAWTWDGVQFEILHPTLGSYDSTKWKTNARSCTVKITAGAHSILMAGDIEAVQEAELVESMPEKLPASVLLAPHHGSGTSSTEPFLHAVRPQVAIFQVGYRNRYHHPKKEVFDRYGELGIERLRSDEAGAISVRFDTSMDISQYRNEHARYWYGR